MNKQLYVFYLFIFNTQLLFGQTDQQGGRLTAMGNNGAAVKDIWGTVANPATIVNTQAPTLHISHEKHFFAKELSSGAIAFVFPSKRYSFGFNIQHYGIPEFSTLKTGLVFTKQFGPHFSIGLRTNYHQIKITTYGTTTGISLDIGTLYQLNEQLCFGLYLNNPSKETYHAKAVQTTIPTIAHVGIAFKPGNKFLIATTLSKELQAPWNIAIGFDYQLIKSFSMRSGISLMAFKQYVGLGFNSSHFNIDVTLTKHPKLGSSPQITIGYVF